MPVVCCDTSFLFSLYGRDVNSPAALAEVQRLRQVLTLTVLNEFELLNALRFAVFRKVISLTAVTSIVAAFEADLSDGRLVIERANLAQTVAEAKRLSATCTSAGGHRSFDLLHVAAATQLKARLFLSFDANQCVLARRAGLKVLT